MVCQHLPLTRDFCVNVNPRALPRSASRSHALTGCAPHSVACTVRRPHAHGPVSILTCMPSCSHASPIPSVCAPLQMAANFNVKILKCRQEVGFTKMPQLLVVVDSPSQVHGNVLGFFTSDGMLPRWRPPSAAPDHALHAWSTQQCLEGLAVLWSRQITCAARHRSARSF